MSAANDIAAAEAWTITTLVHVGSGQARAATGRLLGGDR